MPPAQDGGAQISEYVVFKSNGYEIVNFTMPASGAITVLSLKNGQAYSFKLAAINKAGRGPLSLNSSRVIPATIPSRPVIGAVGLDERIRVTIDAPENDGGAAVEYYMLEWFKGSSRLGEANLSASTKSYNLANLENFVNHEVRVRAFNRVGASPEETLSNISPVFYGLRVWQSVLIAIGSSILFVLLCYFIWRCLLHIWKEREKKAQLKNATIVPNQLALQTAAVNNSPNAPGRGRGRGRKGRQSVSLGRTYSADLHIEL